MKRRIKTVVAVTTLALTASASISADACDRGGRRISFSRSPIGASYSPYSRYSTPTYASPVYSQPQVVYQQPVQSLPPSQISSIPAQHMAPAQQPVNRSMQSGQPVSGAPASTMPRASTAPQQAPATAPRTIANNPAPASPSATQPQSNRGNAEASALELLASIMTTSDNGNTEITAATTTPQIPEFGPSDSITDPAHVGNWKVNLPGNQSVELALNGDGSFTWTATKNGNSSNFQGQYRLENDRLTLVRSNDLQQMAGSWTLSGEGFTFKLDGATTGGLTFNRS